MSSQARGAIGNLAWGSVVVVMLITAYMLQRVDMQRRETEEALDNAMSRAEAVEYITQAMVICSVKDNDEGQIIVEHFQPSARRFFNIERVDIEGKCLCELVVSNDREYCQMAFSELIEGLKSGRLNVWNTSFFRFTGLRRGDPHVEFPILMSVTMREPTNKGEFQFSVIVYSEAHIAKVGVFQER